MLVIDKHREELSVEGNIVPVEPGRRHLCVLYEITQGAGAVKFFEPTEMTHKKSHRRWARMNQVECLEKIKLLAGRKNQIWTRCGQHVSSILRSSTQSRRGKTR